MKKLLLLLALVACESEYSKKCKANGGHIENVNCVRVCNTYVERHGTDQNPVYVPVTRCHRSCDEKCFGARAEGETP